MRDLSFVMKTSLRLIPIACRPDTRCSFAKGYGFEAALVVLSCWIVVSGAQCCTFVTRPPNDAQVRLYRQMHNQESNISTTKTQRTSTSCSSPEVSPSSGTIDLLLLCNPKCAAASADETRVGRTGDRGGGESDITIYMSSYL